MPDANNTPTPPITKPDPVPPVPAVVPKLKWSYPFAAKAKGAVTVQTYLAALGSAQGGFYPLSVSGQWHGGIHADPGTAGLLEQDQGVQCMADGVVVAYLLNDSYPILDYQDGSPSHRALYSTGFVLVRHRLALPPLPPPANQNSAAGPPASSQANTAAATPPPDEVLEFYSLYMHQASWSQYLANGNLKRPRFWKGNNAFRIGNKDRQEADPNAVQAVRAKGANVREAPVDIGHGRYRAGQKIYFLPEGSEVTVGERRGKWGKLAQIKHGAMVGATSGSAGPEESTAEGLGWIYLPEQESVIEPSVLDSVVMLDPPVEIGAGELLGHLGEYQRYEDSQLTPPAAHRALMHIEIFAGDSFKAFLDKSRERAEHLPEGEKTLRLIRAGTPLIARAAQADTSVGPHLELKALTEVGDNVWVKVQPQTVGHTAGAQPKKTLAPAGDPVWIAKSDLAGTQGCPAWSKFPLQGGPQGGQTSYERVYTAPEQALLAHAVDDAGVHWWEVTGVRSDSQIIDGWVSEQRIQKVSPFAWPGFEIVDATGITPKDAFQRQCLATGKLLPGEAEGFKPSAEVVNNSALMKALEKAIDSSGDGTLDTAELKRAMTLPALAQGLSRIIGRYESEWDGNIARWEELTPLMKDGAARWQRELERIKALQWWPKVGGLPGPTVYHFHPFGMIGSFINQGFRFTLEMMRYLFPSADSGALQNIADELNTNIQFYKLDNRLRREHFFAQVMQEVGPSLTLHSESLNYKSEALGGLFSYFRMHPEAARQYGRTSEHAANQEAIANRAYANRGGNGDIESGDGWRFRGRGIIQLTGRKLYRRFTEWHNQNSSLWPQDASVNFENRPELLDQIKYAVRSACNYWLDNGLYTKADDGSSDADVDEVTKSVDPGLFANPSTNEKQKSIKGRRDNFSNIRSWGGLNE